MSYAGLQQFNENLLSLMETEGFKNASDCEKWEIGYKLLNSKYGLGNFYSDVKKLETRKKNIIYGQSPALKVFY